MDYKYILRGYFKQVRPSKVKNIELIWSKYKTQPELLNNLLKEKYGFSPTEWYQKANLTDYLTRYAPNKLEHVDQLLNRYSHHMEQLDRKLSKKYGVSLLANQLGGAASGRQRLTFQKKILDFDLPSDHDLDQKSPISTLSDLKNIEQVDNFTYLKTNCLEGNVEELDGFLLKLFKLYLIVKYRDGSLVTPNVLSKLNYQAFCETLTNPGIDIKMIKIGLHHLGDSGQIHYTSFYPRLGTTIGELSKILGLRKGYVLMDKQHRTFSPDWVISNNKDLYLVPSRYASDRSEKVISLPKQAIKVMSGGDRTYENCLRNQSSVCYNVRRLLEKGLEPKHDFGGNQKRRNVLKKLFQKYPPRKSGFNPKMVSFDFDWICGKSGDPDCVNLSSITDYVSDIYKNKLTRYKVSSRIKSILGQQSSEKDIFNLLYNIPMGHDKVDRFNYLQRFKFFRITNLESDADKSDVTLFSINVDGDFIAAPAINNIHQLIRYFIRAPRLKGGGEINNYVYDTSIKNVHLSGLKGFLGEASVEQHPAWVNIWDPGSFSQEKKQLVVISSDDEANILSESPNTPLRPIVAENISIIPTRNVGMKICQINLRCPTTTTTPYIINNGFSVNELAHFMKNIYDNRKLPRYSDWNLSSTEIGEITKGITTNYSTDEGEDPRNDDTMEPGERVNILNSFIKDYLKATHTKFDDPKNWWKYAIQLLLDLKKSGDWGLVKYISFMREENAINMMLISGDKQCALANIMVGNPTMFGGVIENAGRSSIIGIYIGEELHYSSQYLVDELNRCFHSLGISLTDAGDGIMSYQILPDGRLYHFLLFFKNYIIARPDRGGHKSSYPLLETYIRLNYSNLINLFDNLTSLSKITERSNYKDDTDDETKLYQTIIYQYKKLNLFVEIVETYIEIITMDLQEIARGCETYISNFIGAYYTGAVAGIDLSKISFREPGDARGADNWMDRSSVNRRKLSKIRDLETRYQQDLDSLVTSRSVEGILDYATENILPNLGVILSNLGQVNIIKYVLVQYPLLLETIYSKLKLTQDDLRDQIQIETEFNQILYYYLNRRDGQDPIIIAKVPSTAIPIVVNDVDGDWIGLSNQLPTTDQEIYQRHINDDILAEISEIEQKQDVELLLFFTSEAEKEIAIGNTIGEIPDDESEEAATDPAATETITDTMLLNKITSFKEVLNDIVDKTTDAVTERAEGFDERINKATQSIIDQITEEVGNFNTFHELTSAILKSK